jgi:hypothetical protein
MCWILDLDISLLVSGIVRKHGIVPKPFLGHPQYFPPPKIIHVFQEQKIFQEREFVASQIGDYKKIFFNRANLFGGAVLLSPPHLTPQIQCLHDGCFC